MGMTNKEALKKVRGYLTSYLPLDDAGEIDEIMQALEQEPCEIIKEIPKDYKYDTETNDFLVYRHMYTGHEIHIEKPVPRYRLEQPSNDDNNIIDEHYKKGFANGIRTAEWRYNNAIKEIREHADRLKDSLYGDGLRHALEIIDKYKLESHK